MLCVPLVLHRELLGSDNIFEDKDPMVPALLQWVNASGAVFGAPHLRAGLLAKRLFESHAS